MTDFGLVSIITPSYNSERLIGETIESIKAQTYTNWELLITDDCSTDETWEVIQEYVQKDKRIKAFRLDQNSGAGKARNNSIKHALGAYLTFIDADDLWETDFIEKSLHYSKELNADFVFSSYYRTNETFDVKYSSFIVPKRVSYNDVLKTCPISCLTAFINIDKLGKKYMPDLKKRQDAALWLSYLKDIDFAYGIKEPLATYRMREDSLSRNKLSAAKYQWLLYKRVEKLSYFKSLYYMFHWAYNGMLKYRL